MTDKAVLWKLHLAAPPETVYAFFATDAGRIRFWPEESRNEGDVMRLNFLGEPDPVLCRILEQRPPERFVFTYIDGTNVILLFQPDGAGGTDLTVTETGFSSEAHWAENYAGWITVLMNLKAAADHGVDLRNHDPARTWTTRYCET